MERELPICRHRGDEVRRGHWACSSTKLIVLHGSVVAEDCRACPYADHPSEPGPQKLASRNPQSNGDRIGGWLHPREVSLQTTMVDVAMIAAPRCVRTVEPSLMALRRGGFVQIVDVFVEPGVGLALQSDIRIHGNPTQLGAWRNWRQAARFLLENSTAPFLMICEDDIRLSADAALGLQHAIDTLPHDNWGFASLYTPRWNLRRHISKPGWQAVDLREGGWGALALCFTRDSLAELLATTEPQSAQAESHADILATTVFGALGRRCYFHLPSLCLHAGDGISTLGHAHGDRTQAVGFRAEGGSYQPSIPLEADNRRADAQRGIDPADFSDTTICITVLFRFDCLRELLQSIRRYCPTIEIVVADNSFRAEDWGNQEFQEFRDIVIRHGARAVMLPFDSGISATRNAAVTAARTPYVVVCEEDFEFTWRTNLEAMLRPIRTGNADVVGGLEHYTSPSNGWVQACVPPHLPPMVQYASHVDITGPWLRRQLVFRPVDNRDATELSGVICRKSDVIHNFYAARRDAYLRAPCDDRIKVCEHLDHFLRLKESGARVYYTPEAAIDHKSPAEPRDPRFQRLRHTGANYHQRFCDNWGLDPAGTSDFGSLIGLTPVAFIERR